MATTKKTTTKKAASKKAPTPKAGSKQPAEKKAAAEKAPVKKAATKKSSRGMSAIDAAAKVLGESKEPLNTKQMIEQMEAKGYWKSPGGKTPSATLYSAILREVQTKGKEARFVKVERGQFTINAGTTSAAKTNAKARGKTAKKANAKPANGTRGPKAVSELFKI